MSHLFSPLTVRTLTLRNRLWVAPMCQYSVMERDGIPVDWHLVHLGQYASGGAGLVVTEATAVSPEGRISPEDTGIWNDAQKDAWVRIVDFLHSQGAAAGIQLAHAGRKASTFAPWGPHTGHGSVPLSDGGWQTFGPSAVPFGDYATPEALDADGIEKVVEDFRSAAVRARLAGFDVLEIHAAHGYLLHQFLSPLSNDRTDEYGGSLENRARLLLRVVEAIREVAGDLALFVRFSASDWTEGGWNEDDTATVAGWARDAGADLFDISSGGNVPAANITVGPGYQVPFAAHVKQQAGVPVSAVGLITEPAQADKIVATGDADAVMAGREFLRDPHFAARAAFELGDTLDYLPGQYERAPRG